MSPALHELNVEGWFERSSLSTGLGPLLATGRLMPGEL
jgi:hypothetical protein